MKILLTTLNSKYIHSNLALKYLYESAGIYREQIEIKEFTINSDDMSVFMEIMRGEYDIVCFSCYIWNITRTKGLIKDIKKARPETVIITGGPEVSFETEMFLEDVPEVDLVIKGEGDEVFFDVLKMFEEGGYDPENRIIEGPAAEECNICFPYENSDMDPDKIVYYETARGCPYRCSFCLSSVSRGVRLFPLERVYKELDYFLDKGVKQVKFVDRTFNIDLDRAADIMNYIIDKDNGSTNFHFELCGDRISEEMLSAFERARTDLFQIEIGVQSAQPEVLDACSRKVDFEKLKENTIRIEARNNVHVHLDLIAGLPYETFEMFADSFNKVYALEPHDLQLGFLKLLKGTKLREEAEKHGYIYRNREPYEVISNKYISSEEIVRLKMVEQVLELYFNKPGFRNTLKYVLEKSVETPFGFYSELAEFYFEQGHHKAAQSKNALYDILWSFIEYRVYENKECLKELLLYDKISAASPSQYSCREYADAVHEYLRNEYTVSEEWINTKNLIKKVNYMTFEYNVDEACRGEAELRKNGEKRLLIFFPDKRDAAGQALCKRIYY